MAEVGNVDFELAWDFLEGVRFGFFLGLRGELGWDTSASVRMASMS